MDLAGGADAGLGRALDPGVVERAVLAGAKVDAESQAAWSEPKG